MGEDDRSDGSGETRVTDEELRSEDSDDEPTESPETAADSESGESASDFEDSGAEGTDVSIEGEKGEDDTADLEPEPSDRIERLETQLAEKDVEIEELTSRLKRTKADFQNYKKRIKKQQEETRERATEELVERLLDVRDNLDRAISADHENVDGLREGIKMTLAELDRIFDAENVSRIEPKQGADVDPRRHEVMMRVESQRPEDTIDEVYAPGYEMGNKILRPAQITVSEGSVENGGTDPDEVEQSDSNRD